ncbi:hypothetical protein [uncultured Polaribacter sp.]|uniref:HNH endonuclease n=1 Tax=uncultured Polaribacter sp. TaxID=174711 RepID=UPI00262C7EB3|nr:hypothetical protein [uncultured Polaribacter sp.]
MKSFFFIYIVFLGIVFLIKFFSKEKSSEKASFTSLNKNSTKKNNITIVKKTKASDSKVSVKIDKPSKPSKPSKPNNEKHFTKFHSEIKNWRTQNIESLSSFMSIEDVLILNKDDEITYTSLLNTFDWRFKRLKILFRDKFACVNCKFTSESNHVHHKYYVMQKFPWEYEDIALVTLCYNCHKKVHSENEINIYRKENIHLVKTDWNSVNCSRCGGIGYLEEFSHVQGGVCFKCKGNTINYKTFFKRIERFYKYSHLYEESKNRLNYVNWINRLSDEQIFKNVTFIGEYKDKSNYNFKNDFNYLDSDYDDDLPF